MTKDINISHYARLPAPYERQYPNLNIAHMRAWAEDLRTTKQPQGRGRLRETDGSGAVVGDCCLGRVCDILSAKVGEWQQDASNPTLIVFVYDYIPASGVLPQVAQDWLGIPTSSPRLPFRDRWIEATQLNDQLGLSFAEIAQCIDDLIELELAASAPVR